MRVLRDSRPFTRRGFLVASAAATAGLLAPGTADASIPRRTISGAYVEPRRGEKLPDAVRRFERMIGRKTEATRHYLKWHNRFPNDAARWSAAGGRVPVISWEIAPTVTWPSLYRGEHDAYLREQAHLLREWGARAILTVEHEPEYWLANVGGSYTPENFRKMYDHVVRVFRSVGVPNVRYALVLQGGTYHGGHGGPRIWTPTEHDLVGSDGYNRHRAYWETFATVFRPGHAEAVRQGKPFYVQEFGCEDDPRKARWFSDAAATIRRWGNVAAVLYTNSTAEFQGRALDFRVNSRPHALRAYRRNFR